MEWFQSLRRSTSDSLLAGVAGGLAATLGVPPILVRAGFVLATFAGIGLPLYLVAWVFVPTDRGERLLGRSSGWDLVALGAVVLAGLLLMGEVAEVSLFRVAWRLAPWALLLGGLALLLRRRDPSAAPMPPVPSTPAPPGAPPGPLHGPPAPPSAAPSGAVAAVPSATSWDPPAAPAPRRTLQPPVVGPLTWCIVLFAAGVMGIIAAGDGDAITPGVVAAVSLVIFGLGLVVSAFVGRARGLILPALALSLLLGGLGALDLRADVLGGTFDRVIATEAQLPTSLSTAVGPSTVDLRNLTLTEDRSLRIDHFAGRLEIGLPVATTTVIRVVNSYGEIRLARPSIGSIGWSDPDLARKWIDEGAPEPGSPLAEDVGADRWWESLPTLGAESLGDGARTVRRRTFDNGSEHRLLVEVRMGVGQVELFDPHWADDARPLMRPVQLCTVGGGPRGVVQPCDEVPVEQRVALCINDNGFLVDCREDRSATPDHPRVAACRGFTGEYESCDSLHIDPVGAELVTPGGVDVDGDGVPDETAPEATIAPPGPLGVDPTVPPEPSVAPAPTVPSPTPPTVPGAS